MRSFDRDDPRSRMKKKWSGASLRKGYNGFPFVPRKPRSDTPRISAYRRWGCRDESPEPTEADLEDEHDVAEALFCLSNMAAAVIEPKPKSKRSEPAIDKKRKKLKMSPRPEDVDEPEDDSGTEDVKSDDKPPNKTSDDYLAAESRKKQKEDVQPSPSKGPRGPTWPAQKAASPRKAAVLKMPEEPKSEPAPSIVKKSTDASQSSKERFREAEVAPRMPEQLRRPWKRCATHVYIANFIEWQQSLQREHMAKHPSVPWKPPPFHFNLPCFNDSRPATSKQVTATASPRKASGSGGSTPKKASHQGRQSSAKLAPPEHSSGPPPPTRGGGGGMGPPGQSPMGPMSAAQQHYASQLQQLALHQQLQNGGFPFAFPGGMPGFPGGAYGVRGHHGSGMPPGGPAPFYGQPPSLGLGLHHMAPHGPAGMHHGMEGGKGHKGDMMRDGGAAELARRFASSQQEMLAKHATPAHDNDFIPGASAADMKHLPPEVIYGLVNGSAPPPGIHSADQRMHALYGAGEPPHGYRS